MPINEIDIVQTPSGQLVTEIELQQGLPGPPNTLEIGSVTPAETGVPAAASITGSSPSQLLHLTLPKGNTGTAATIAVGETTTGAAGSDALVTNAGTNSAAVFNFTIPRGNTGAAGTAATIAVGETTTGAAGSDALVTNAGTSSAAVFNFTIPRGNTGATGPATELSVSGTTTGAAGSEASVTISGTAPVQSLAFTIPRGNTGATGPATVLSVANTITGEAGTNASVTISGDAPNQSLTFTIPRGPQGIQGPTGSSGATALLTGYVSSPGTVAATDTVIQAVGKLNGNDEQKAPIASLYPYIGGKLLTYTDEEAAIADPLISAGDIYRKTAGGVDYVNPDNVPSLDLRFATDKTLTARRGPTPTFTRGSGATYIGSDGLIHGIDTSTTSNSISAASKTFTLDATAGQDQLWRAGDAVEASNGSNIMAGTVTSYTPSTQSLVCNMTTASGTGTFTSWRIGYRGPRFDHNPVSRTNLLARSEEFDDGYWTKLRTSVPTPNTAISPSGSLNADKLVEDASNNTHMVYRVLNTGSLAAHTFSVFAKADGRNFVYLDCGDGFPLNSNAYFNLSNGTLGTIGANATASITAFGNGWYRCSITATPTSTTTNGFYIQIASANGTRSYQGDGTSGIFIWGAQVEAGSTATSYIPTTTASVTIRDCRGLLIEESRQNLFSSTNLNDWSAARVTRTAITGIGLTNQATTLTISETGSTYLFRGVTLTTGVAYAISVRVKAGTVASCGFGDLVDTKYSRSFNLSTNQWAASGAAAEFTNYTVTPNIDGWFLVSAIYTPTGATGVKNIAFFIYGTAVGQTASYDTPQIEAGSFPTSYIPTTTGTLARGADVCSITGGNFNNFYNQSEGTMLVNSSCFAPEPLALPSRRVVTASDGTTGNRVAIANIAAGFIASGLSQALIVVTGGSPQSDIGIAGLTLSSLNKTAAAYKENNFAVSTNSSAVVTDAIGLVATSLNRLEIGNQISDGFLCGHIAAIRYYKKRLPNAKLQALTV